MCGTTIGADLDFGIDNDELSLTTNQVSVVHRADQKEARDRCGDVVSVTFYNKHHELTIEGLGTTSATVAANVTLTGSYGITGLVIIQEITVDRQSEEYKRTSIRATAWEGITTP